MSPAPRDNSPVIQPLPSHTSPSAIATHVAALQRPITAAEIHELLDRASQPLPPPTETSELGVQGMEHVHQRLLGRLRDLREDSLSRGASRRREANRGHQVASAVDTPTPASPARVSHPIQATITRRSRGLPPTNTGPSFQQPEPVVVRSTPQSPLVTVMSEFDPAVGSQATNRPRSTQPSSEPTPVVIQITHPLPFTQREQDRIRAVYPVNTNIVFNTVSSAPTPQRRLTPDETLHIAFTDAPPLWQRPHARTHIRDRDPSLTYRGMTVAARIGGTVPRITRHSDNVQPPSVSPDSDESGILFTFSSLREMHHAPSPSMSPVSSIGSDMATTRPISPENPDDDAVVRHHPDQRENGQPHTEPGPLESALDRRRQALERVIARHELEVLRQQHELAVTISRRDREHEAHRARQSHGTGTVSNGSAQTLLPQRHSDISASGPPDRSEPTTSSVDEEVHRFQQAEAELLQQMEAERLQQVEAGRLHSLAQDIVYSLPNQPSEADSTGSARHRGSVPRSTTRVGELSGLRANAGEVRAESAHVADQATGSGSRAVAVVEVTGGVGEGLSVQNESGTVFEGAGERREGAGGQREERTG